MDRTNVGHLNLLQQKLPSHLGDSAEWEYFNSETNDSYSCTLSSKSNGAAAVLVNLFGGKNKRKINMK